MRVRREWRSRQVGVDELERILRGERQPAGEQLVERDPERVEVAPAIDPPVVAAGLLGRDVVQRAFEVVDLVDDGPLALELGRDPEVDDADGLRRRDDDDVRRVDVLVDDAAGVDAFDRAGERQRELELARERGRRDPQQPVQREPLDVFHHEDRDSVVIDPPEHLDGERAARLRGQALLPDQRRDGLAGRMGAVRGLEDDAPAIVRARATQDERARAAVELLEITEAGDRDRHRISR